MTLRMWRWSALLLLGLCSCRNAEKKAAQLIAEAEAAIAGQRWDLAFSKAHEAATLQGISEGIQNQARLKEDQARAELQAASQYTRFVGALDTDNDTAVAAYRDLPATSYYRAQGKEAYERIRPVYIDSHLEKAKAALDNKRCADAKSQAQLVLDVDPQNTKAMELTKAPCNVPKEE